MKNSKKTLAFKFERTIPAPPSEVFDGWLAVAEHTRRRTDSHCEDTEKDILRLQEDFYILFRYGDVPDESEFLRSPRSLWLQIKCDNVEEMTRKILDFGAAKIDLPSGLPESVPYLYFQSPGGQCIQ